MSQSDKTRSAAGDYSPVDISALTDFLAQKEASLPPLPPLPRVVRNAARCRLCGDLLESKHRHDFKSCSCGALSVDGGLAYVRRSWDGKRGDYEEMAEELSEYAVVRVVAGPLVKTVGDYLDRATQRRQI